MSQQRAEFLSGARDTFPLIVGAVPFGIIFGTLSVNSGLSLAATMGLSLFVFAGSAQFIAVGMVAAGAAWPIIALTTFVVNLRHMLYSATLAPRLGGLSAPLKAASAFLLTDEAFAVMAGRFSAEADVEENRLFAYYAGSALFMYLNWQICTLIGALFGALIPGATEWGLDFAMPITFIGMLVPYLRGLPMLSAAGVAALVAVLGYGLPHKLGLMAGALCGMAAGCLMHAVCSRRRAEVGT